MVGGDGRSVHSVTHTSNYTSSGELCERLLASIRSDLYNNIGDHDDGTGNDTFLTTELVTPNEHEDGTEKTP